MRNLIAVHLIGVALAVLAGCATFTPSRFYILSPVPADMAVRATGREAAIGVGPINLPEYLNRPQIAVRNGAYELLYSETHRWAEALQANFTDVLAENLALLIPTNQVAIYPWGRATMIDYQVMAEVSRFDADANGNVTLSASWKLVGGENREVIAMKKSTFTEAAGGSDYEQIVAAQSRALAALSREIAGAVRTAAAR